MGQKLSKDNIIEALLNTSFLRSTGATSLADIANSLGVKKASLYNHFQSREDLVNQTMASCRDYIDELTFIPADVENVAKKYPAETVFKGIVNRYFRMHEKAPLFQIYTFVQSQKYFVKEAADIVTAEQQSLTKQTETMLNALLAQNKIKLSQEKISGAATWFASGLSQMLDNYLLVKKDIIMKNPAAGDGELFALPADDTQLKLADSYVETFIQLIE